MTPPPHPAKSRATGDRWRGTARAALWLALVLAPLMVTAVVPFVDFHNHMARIHILTRLDSVPAFAALYSANWDLLPNMGLDVLALPLFHLLPPLAADRLVAILLVTALFLGLVLFARRLGAPPVLALPAAAALSHNHILHWGFGAYLLALALALATLALAFDRHLQLVRRRLPGLAVLAVLIYLGHGFAFMLFGILAGLMVLAGAAARHPLQQAVVAALPDLARLLLLALVPVALFLISSTAHTGPTVAIPALAGGETPDWVRWLGAGLLRRLAGFVKVFETGNPPFDRGFTILVWAALLVLPASGRARLRPGMTVMVAGLVALYLVMPPTLFGAGYLADRLPMLIMAVLVFSLRAGPRPATSLTARRLYGTVPAVLAVLHLGVATALFANAHKTYDRFLTAIQVMQAGESVFLLDLYYGVPRRDATFPRCQPLLHLPVLYRNAVAPVFAIPGQHPLSRRMEGPGHRVPPPRTARLARETDNARSFLRARLEIARSYDWIIACGAGHDSAETGRALGASGARKVAEGRHFTLYRHPPGTR